MGRKKTLDYYVEENTGQHKNHLKWMVMSRRNGVITSHLDEDTTKQHVDKNNTNLPEGLDRSVSYKAHKRYNHGI